MNKMARQHVSSTSASHTRRRRLAFAAFVCEPLAKRLLMAAGDPDFAFGSVGRATLNFPGAAMTITDTAVAPDGKVIVGGNRGANMAVARLNVNGSIDTTFGNGGLYESTRRPGVTSVAVQSD